MVLCMNAKSFDGPLRYEQFVSVLILFHRQAENSITLGRGGVLGTVEGWEELEEAIYGTD